MLSRSHVLEALRRKEGAFASYQRRSGSEYDRLSALLQVYQALSRDEVEDRLAAVARPGLLPTHERGAGRSVVASFKPHWDNHREARLWAMDKLQGVITVGVDGSQIAPDRAFSVPIGAVQVGWFRNEHVDDKPYVKDIEFEILSPIDLDARGAAQGSPEQLVSLVRFERECQRLCEEMQAIEKGARAVCFLDGSFIVTFAGQVSDAMRARYVASVERLLHTSQELQVPLLGFVDTSYAVDLAHMLQHVSGEDGSAFISDAALLRGEMHWGDRTETWLCARDDDISEQAGYYHEVCVTYLKTTAANPPARVEFPRWMLDSGESLWAMDVLRAECVVGTGYPYAIETADALAVISARDRERFYGYVQEYLSEQGVRLGYSRKAASKRVRR